MSGEKITPIPISPMSKELARTSKYLEFLERDLRIIFMGVPGADDKFPGLLPKHGHSAD